MAMGISIFLDGCGRSQEAFLTVGVCAGDQGGVEQVLETMRATAKSAGLKFIDQSAETRANLENVDANKSLKYGADSLVDAHIEGAGGMGVTASNLGLPPFQIALGFTAGSDSAKGHHLADQLVRALSERWHVQKIPEGEGVRPLKECGG